MRRAQKSGDSRFIFRRHDNVGSMAAEEDDEFLRACFVETGDLDLLKDPTDNRIIVLGRTGSGKTALLRELERHSSGTVIRLKPEDLALSYLSNSTVLQFFESIGVNLDPFFKLLWRHVLVVELFKQHFQQPSDVGLIERLRSLFSGRSAADKRALRALEYLRKWGESFWQETEYRVREITQRIEDELEASMSLGFDLSSFKGSVGQSARGSISAEQRQELVNRGQRIVSRAQAQDLSSILDLLAGVLQDRQQVYYLSIDQLDESWIEERLRYNMIMALVYTAREFIRVENAKVILSLRRDLIERVFRLTRDSGFQEEKYQSLYLPLEWRKDDIIELLNRRVAELVRRRSSDQEVGYRDILPPRISKHPIEKYLFDRAKRPRDAIALINVCISVSEGKPKINTTQFRKAEGEWSRSRLEALGAEWAGDYPQLLDFATILRSRPTSFKLSTLSEDEVKEFCLERAAERPGGKGMLQAIAAELVDLLVSAQETRRKIILIFYRIGLVGLKTTPTDAVSWVDQYGRGVSAAEVQGDTSVVIHPAYYRALGVRSR